MIQDHQNLLSLKNSIEIEAFFSLTMNMNSSIKIANQNFYPVMKFSGKNWIIMFFASKFWAQESRKSTSWIFRSVIKD